MSHVSHNTFVCVGGSIELGTNLTKQDLEKLKSTRNVVNCLGMIENKIS